MKQIIVTAFIVLFVVSAAQAQMRITEWMYNGLGKDSKGKADNSGEFVEFTNVGSSDINMAGWSFDDNSRTPGSQDLSAFGIVAKGESVLFTDVTDSVFRTDWGLAATVKVIGGNTNNLGRADEINLYDASSNLVDRLTYDDQTLGGVRTNNVSGNPGSMSDLGANDAPNWVLSYVGDAYGSRTSAWGEIGNPGVYAVPEPATIVLLVSGLFMLTILSRSRRI